MGKKPIFQLRTGQILFYLNAAIWLGLAIYTLIVMSGRYPGGALMVWIVGLLMLGNSAAMLAAGWFLGTQRRWAWLFGLAVLGVNILLTFTDQLGLLDIITLLIDLVLFCILVIQRKLYQ